MDTQHYCDSSNCSCYVAEAWELGAYSFRSVILSVCLSVHLYVCLQSVTLPVTFWYLDRQVAGVKHCRMTRLLIHRATPGDGEVFHRHTLFTVSKKTLLVL